MQVHIYTVYIGPYHSFLADILCSVKMFNADKDSPHCSDMLPLQKECLGVPFKQF